jgi:diguanylate cyclase (GGDEF)-like protein
VGRSYDARVVECIERRYQELETEVKNTTDSPKYEDYVAKSGRQVVPSAGFAELPNPAEVRAVSFLASIVSARQEAQLLFELAQTLGNSLSLRETLSVVAVRLKEMIPHDSIVFFICQDNKLVPKYAHGIDYELWVSLQIPLGQGISGWVAQNKKPIINGNPASESKYLGDPRRVSHLQSALAIPLQGRDKVAGVLTLYLREKQGFTNDHLRLLLAASSKLGLSVENALQFEQAEDTASTDFLTGLPNARSICVQLERELSRSVRNNTPLAVLLCDLNGFKKVNDNFGHLIGNKLLKEVAKNLKTACREYDQVGRLGGDEFVFVLPECTPDAVEDLKGRMQQAVQAAAQTACAESVVSLSIGCAFHPADGSAVDELLAEADQRMYLSKEMHYKQVEELERMPAKVRS